MNRRGFLRLLALLPFAAVLPACDQKRKLVDPEPFVQRPARYVRWNTHIEYDEDGDRIYSGGVEVSDDGVIWRRAYDTGPMRAGESQQVFPFPWIAGKRSATITARRGMLDVRLWKA